jgi:hypothetical protein
VTAIRRLCERALTGPRMSENTVHKRRFQRGDNHYPHLTIKVRAERGRMNVD